MTDTARWLASKLTTAAAFAVGGTLFLMAVLQLGVGCAIGARADLHWADRGVYEATGPVLVAYGLLGVAVGAAVGLLVRRTLLAASLATVVTGGVPLLFGSLRWDLFPTRTITETSRLRGYWHVPLPYDSFAVDQGVTNAAGERFIDGLCHPEPIPGRFCPTDTKVTSAYLDYHPRSHFWYLQLIETGSSSRSRPPRRTPPSASCAAARPEPYDRLARPEPYDRLDSYARPTARRRVDARGSSVDVPHVMSP
ncbi:hypothetical protein [Streptomyces kanamyceticus]|uniref:ABC transporter permease n=1 Tax=Streptomyces kanamyceticus TaxID=1967 RepID=A0A5J6GHQ9_STRKN|nr:hypothetical protein [Streptomyces kanamyceticus]QEU93435.1 hypothetical protein CP970_23230 [Streptomyces kanamyceticus]